MIENNFKYVDVNRKIENDRQVEDKIVGDFENAFLAGFMHYRNNPQNRFPGAAQLLYVGLYKPESLEETMNIEIGGRDHSRFKKRVAEIVNISQYANLENVPTLDEFKNTLRLSLRHGVGISAEKNGSRVIYDKEETGSFEDALYPDVPQAINELWEKYKAQIVIWTAGDSSPWRGQFYKVANVLSSLRKGKNFGEQKRSMLSVIVENDKMQHLADVLIRLRGSDIKKIILIEDRLKNLQDGQIISKKCAVPLIPVWVRREGTEFADMYDCKDIKEDEKKILQEEYNAVETFADVQKKLEHKMIIKEGEKIGMIVDFDGVLSDSSITNQIWAKSIVSTLLKNNWIKSTE